MVWKLTDNFKGRFNRVGHKGKTGAKHPCWKGGRIIDRDGYIRTWAPTHPWPRKGYIAEHVRVMELSINRRLLPSECVHHIDENRQNNSLDNLQVMDRSEHSKLHREKDKHRQNRNNKGHFKCGSI